MVRVAGRLISLLLLLSVAELSWGQAAGAPAAWSPRRDRRQTATTSPSAAGPTPSPAIVPASAERDTGGASGTTDNLRWRQVEEPSANRSVARGGAAKSTAGLCALRAAGLCAGHASHVERLFRGDAPFLGLPRILAAQSRHGNAG